MDNKVQHTIGNAYCLTCRNEISLCILTNKMSYFYVFEVCKACCHVLKIPFKDQGPTTFLFSQEHAYCFVTIWTENPTLCFLSGAISPPNTINYSRTWAKKQKTFHLWHNCVDFPLVDTINPKFISCLILCTWVYSKKTWFCRSPMTVLSDLLNFDQIQLLWLEKISSRKWH